MDCMVQISILISEVCFFIDQYTLNNFESSQVDTVAILQTLSRLELVLEVSQKYNQCFLNWTGFFLYYTHPKFQFQILIFCS